MRGEENERGGWRGGEGSGRREGEEGYGEDEEGGGKENNEEKKMRRRSRVEEEEERG